MINKFLENLSHTGKIVVSFWYTILNIVAFILGMFAMIFYLKNFSVDPSLFINILQNLNPSNEDYTSVVVYDRGVRVVARGLRLILISYIIYVAALYLGWF